MKYFAMLIICTLILSGCAPSKSTSRYDSIEKQQSYISMKFALDSEDYIGKTKAEIIQMLGNPVRTLARIDKGISNDMWIYYPQGTNNFIAIMISFEGDIVQNATYESVM